ncbi:acyltransferase [Flavobacteriaceae bacterium]|nr:acyltransferase [Flavobacteriaceae bacterium]
MDTTKLVKNSTYIKELDGFRSVAVMAVMLVHWGVFGAGWIGVQMFFVLSGYLISANLLRDRDKNKSISPYLKNFFWRRFLRLSPLYFLYVILFIIIGFILGTTDIQKLIIPLLTYTINIYALIPGHVEMSGIGHFWSLAVEEQFYLFWPFLIFFISLKYFKKLLILLILSGPIIKLILFTWISDMYGDTIQAAEAVNILVLGQIDAFAIGGAVAFFSSKQIKRPQLCFYIVLIITAILGGINLLTLIINNDNDNIIGILHTFGFPHLMLENYQFIWGYSLLNILFALLIICIINKKNPIGFLKNPVLIYLGKISYGIYVYHVVVLMLIRHIWDFRFSSLLGILLFIVYFTLTILLAHISYKYYEKPFLMLKDKFKNI